jgi:hypothetical protein
MNLRKYPLALILVPVLTLTACLSTLAVPTNTKQGKSPEATDSNPLATQQVTFASTPTSTATPTPAPTQPPTEKPFVWAGEWNFYYPTSGSTEKHVVFVQSGNSISFIVTAGESGSDETYNGKGTLTPDGMSVSGTWENITYSSKGTFQWKFVADNGYQFVGSTGEDAIGPPQAWCGYRTGAPQPDPCMWP